MARRDDTWPRHLTGKKIDKYTLDEFVGAGRIGYVYRSHHEDFPKAPLAVKLIFDPLRVGWENELRKVMALQLVDGVVHFRHLGADHVSHNEIIKLCQFTVWDYIAPGHNLRGYLKNIGKVPVGFVVAVVERILHVLHSCQENGVERHGDLHAGNILIGDKSNSRLDDSLEPRAPIFVSDFGYGTTGGATQPKDDYAGLAAIINEMIPFIEHSTATATHRQILRALRDEVGKFLREPPGPERRRPLDILKALIDIKRSAQTEERSAARVTTDELATPRAAAERPSVGQFQVSEMIGDRWDWWLRLFVPRVPARSRILALDIPTVVTGPRGCGKTMLFRRLSERLVVECGEVADLEIAKQFAALYVNANDFADAFAHYPISPAEPDEARLTCYANLCILGDLLAVQSARAGRMNDTASDGLLSLVANWLVPEHFSALVMGEDRLESYRALLEQIKWTFNSRPDHQPFFPGFYELCQHRWLPHFIQQVKVHCPWIGDRTVLLFIDDFSTPRISPSMQRTLNRLLLQRSPEFLAKVATEAWSTFVPEDSSGKNLQDGDDYQLIDMGEESLFLPDVERTAFLEEVFSRRLRLDPRVPEGVTSLKDLLATSSQSKTEFARRLRVSLSEQRSEGIARRHDSSQRRGRSRGRVEYFGQDVFSSLWSGDTRTMIQLITDVLDQAAVSKGQSGIFQIAIPVSSAVQDRAFRNRGGEWLNSHTRNEPTDTIRMKAALNVIKAEEPDYKLCGEYGDHLKAVVEAFVSAATNVLLGPTYNIREGARGRIVPRMAFRLEILDEFRIDGLVQEIYRDLIRYGLFMRDNRGKSVRGAFVPRLYLRRLLLPYCTLALSKRDSVQLTSEKFKQLLLYPDKFRASLPRTSAENDSNQITMPFMADVDHHAASDSTYDDLSDEE